MRLLRNGAGGYCLAIACAMLTGCVHHPQAPPPVSKAQTPNVYVPPPETADLPPMQAGPPPTVTDAKPAVAEEVKPKKRTKRKETVAAPAPAPLPPAASDPVAASAEPATLGALGSGPSADPKQQEEVAAKIAAVEKRINELPPATVERELKQIAKVRHFLKEATDALKSGDVEGANILATKAELLLDDITK